MNQTLTVNSIPQIGESFSVNGQTYEFVTDLFSLNVNPVIEIGETEQRTAFNIAKTLNGKFDLEAVASESQVSITGERVEIDVSGAGSLSVG